MTTAEILRAYLESNHLTLSKGSEDSFEPLLPFVIMDAVFQIYCNRVRPMECKHLQNHYKKEWEKNYQAFNSRFFQSFTPDQTDAVVDCMDEYEEFIKNDRLILKVQIMNCCPFLPFDQQDLMSDLILCDILTKAAQSFWTKVYQHENPLLAVVSHNIVKFNTCCYRSEHNLNINDSKPVNDALLAFCKKTVKWLIQKSKPNENQEEKKG